MTAHELAKKLLEMPDVPVALIEWETGTITLMKGDLHMDPEAHALFPEDWEDDHSEKADAYKKQYGTRPMKIKKDAPQREVVVID